MRVGVRVLMVVTLCVAGSASACTSDLDSRTARSPSTTDHDGMADRPRPNGTYLILRWELPPTAADGPRRAGDTTPGFTFARLWRFDSDCAGVDRCDVLVTGGGDGGSYNLDGFVVTNPDAHDFRLYATATVGRPWTGVRDGVAAG